MTTNEVFIWPLSSIIITSFEVSQLF